MTYFTRCPDCGGNLQHSTKYDGYCLECWNTRDLERAAEEQQQKKEN